MAAVLNKVVAVSGFQPGVSIFGVTASDTWITPTFSGNNVTVALSTAALGVNTGNARTGSVTVTATDGATIQISVTQMKKSELLVDVNNITFDAARNMTEAKKV